MPVSTPTERHSASVTRLPSGGVLARGAVWNLLGQGLPFLAALLAIPMLAAGLGTDRFGVLSLAWVLIGYVSLFDLGLGRALTQLVARQLGSRDLRDLPVQVWAALLLMLLLGLFGALVLVLLAPWLIGRALAIPGALMAETRLGFDLIAAAIPFVTVAAGLRGVLEAHQRFGLVNAVRVPMSVLSYLGPLALLPFSTTLALPVGFLLLERIATMLIYLRLCLRVVPALRSNLGIAPGHWPRLLRFGGWMTVTNVVGPLMVYFDRFLIGGMLSIAAVAYYSTPYDFVTRMLVIPAALAGVLFPAFATALQHEAQQATALFLRATKYLFMVLWPLSLLVFAYSREILETWVGGEFAANGSAAMQWLTVGVLLNGLAQIPFALVQGRGRPDLTAKLHLAEAPFYLLAVWWLIEHFGIEGAAVAWTLRVAVDTVVLFAMSRRMLRIPVTALRSPALVLATGMLGLLGAALIVDPVLRTIYCVLALGIFAVAALQALRADGVIGALRDWLASKTKA